jgi:RHS repeat-associated protein
MRNTINALRHDVKSALNNPGAFDDANVDATLVRLRTTLGATIAVRDTKPRWTKDRFPVEDTYRTAPKRSGGSFSLHTGIATQAATLSGGSAPAKLTTNAVPSAVATLAATLNTPAKVFTWVHDRIEWESYSGVAKGSLGALQEGRGNDWDQALLLRDLLTARGYRAQLEWGKVTMPVAQAMNLVGTEDPLQAANLLATAGFDGVVNMNGTAPVSIQMTHAWVRAFIPYTLDRGAATGTADTWVRMDPSFKTYEYQSGIAINGKVAWSEDQYLATSAVRPPTDAYSDQIWSYIRTNNIDCKNLGDVPKTGHIRASNFPFVPATLTAHIDQVGGVADEPPAEQQQTIAFSVNDARGQSIAAYTTTAANAWGKKLTLTFAPATADDAAIIASYGDLYATPAYLVRLVPVFALDDVAVVTGTVPVAVGAALDLGVAFRQPNVPDDAVRHEVVAGETHTEVLDAGGVPDSLLAARIARLGALVNSASASRDAITSEKLYVAGLRYMQRVDDGLAFATGVRWQRGVKRMFEADVRQQVSVAYNVAGAALRLMNAEENIDVSRLLVGVVPINGDPSNRAQTLSLAGLESSYREGAIWEEMQSQQGISAAKALLLSRIAGQQIRTVNASNVDAVLATVTLPDDVEAEIRGAVAQGRIAKIPSASITLNKWSGTGYILEDPRSGAATYPISGGLAGGSTTGEVTDGIKELLGSESWLEGSPLGALLHQLLSLLGGGNSNDAAPSTTQSDPVNMSSGNMYRTFNDTSVVARGIPVAVSRTYNSRSTVNGPFGFGWTWNYGEQLLANDDASMTYREADGTEHRFASVGGAFVSPVGKHLQLTANGNGWTLAFKDGTHFGFDAAGYLVTQTDTNGNMLTIGRDANENPTAIVDASGRTVLTFAIVNEKIITATDVAGRVTTYAYDGDDLTAVTDTAGKTWQLAYDVAHNMTELVDPTGKTQSYDYDADDRMFHHVDANGAEEFLQYDIAARQSVVTDRRGGDRFIQFDDTGRATLEGDPAGNVISATFDADNNRVETIDSRGAKTQYEYDPSGNTTKTTMADGSTTSTTYDASSRPLTSTDALGVTSTNGYDAHGNLLQSTRTVNGVAETTTNVYDGYGRLTSTTDASNHVSSMTWNDNGSLATRTDAANQTTTMTTDALGRIQSIKDPAGNETKLTYDGKDRIQTMTDPYGNATSFTYDAAGRRLQVTSPRGTTTYAYDGEGRVTSVRDTLGNTSRTQYDAAGNVLARIDARGNTTRYEYDAIGRVTKMTDANGGVWSYGYCAAQRGSGSASCSSCGGGGGGGSFCDLTDPDGNKIHQEFDVMGRVVAVTDSLGHTAFTQYDKAGRKTMETDANGNATSWSYDEDGRLVSVTEASGAVTRYTYDKSGNKLTQKDANGHVWSYEYDALNRLKKETDPLLRVTSYTYDLLGNLATKTDGKNQTLTYHYNIRRLTEIVYPNATKDTFTYDTIGRRNSQKNADVTIAYTFDALGRLATQKQTDGYFGTSQTISYAYDPSGNRTELTTALGTTRYAYDGKNRMVAISDANVGNFAFTYDGMDRRTSLAYPNGMKTSYDYDNGYRLTAIVSKDRDGIVQDAWKYTYDAVGNRTTKTDMDGHVETYRYDNVYRLTEATYGDGTKESFAYDAVGNRTKYADQSGTAVTYSFDVANQLKTGSNGETWSYDANGNMIRHGVPNQFTPDVTYDYNNRLTNMSEDNRYAPDGTRIRSYSRNALGNSTYAMMADSAANPVMWFGSQINMYRIYGPGMDDVLAEWDTGYNQKRYLHKDALGSITLVTAPDASRGYRTTYKAFGQPTRTASSVGYSSLGYTGRENGEWGTMYYRARHYDTTTGRFMQQDGQGGRAGSPPSLHRYTYTENNPILYVDPLGHSIEDAVRAISSLGCNDMQAASATKCRVITSGVLFTLSKAASGGNQWASGFIDFLAYVKLIDMFFLWEDAPALADSITASYTAGPGKDIVRDVLAFALEAHAIASIVMFMLSRYSVSLGFGPADWLITKKYIELWTAALQILIISTASGKGPLAVVLEQKMKLEKAAAEIDHD